ncbi:MAG: LLM class flavin-dependent oxidoreductase [Rhodobiaceae bacterium]|nr:MAG: LLM class flavin-dependent oxidoreductase [Rhodobiaceae bacterium]
MSGDTKPPELQPRSQELQPGTNDTSCQFGLFLNMGANLGETHQEVFDFTIEQADAAEELGYHDLWITEHHFIRFGLNPDALAASAFFLGRTRKMRVGTAVALSPIRHPIKLAETAALLDQLSGGRFDLGIGRGGYVKDYEVFDVDVARWSEEPKASAQVLLNAWGGTETALPSSSVLTLMRSPDEPTEILPQPRTKPHPPLFMATSSEPSLGYAAKHGLPLQHYFPIPVEQRIAIEQNYANQLPSGSVAPTHMHSLIAIVTDDATEAREKLLHGLSRSLQTGDQAKVPQAKERHTDANGNPFTYDELAKMMAMGAIIGTPDVVADKLSAFIGATGARRIAIYPEMMSDRKLTLSSIKRFAEEVRPRFAEPKAVAAE